MKAIQGVLTLPWLPSRQGDAPARRPACDMRDLDDAALVAAARDDPEAFTVLYERYLRPVYRYCYLRLGQREMAEDATSEVFLRALASLERHQGRHFAAWLFRIAHNLVVDQLRKHRPTAPVEALGEWADTALSPEDLAVATDERETLRKALETLPPEQRTAMELRLAGWTGEQVAAALGKSPAAARKIQLRAIARLRTLLGGGH